MPDHPGHAHDLTDEQLQMLRLIAKDKPLPWDPQSLIRLQTLKLIERGASASVWLLTPIGKKVLSGAAGRLPADDDPPN